MTHTAKDYMKDYPRFLREIKGREPTETDLALARWIGGLIESAYSVGVQHAQAGKHAAGLPLMGKAVQEVLDESFPHLEFSQSDVDTYTETMYNAYLDGYREALKASDLDLLETPPLQDR